MKNLAFWIGAAILTCGVVAVVTAAEGEGPMPDLDGRVTWLNSTLLNTKSLRGKVVLVNFWTYSCSNSLRELPYIKAWAARCEDAGLVVIGVHAPEFGFEKDPANVENAVSELGITFPVPIDSGRSIWSAFRNEYWPADYLIDRNGRIRYHHFGEGDYEKSGRVIQELLRAGGAAGLSSNPVRIAAAGAEAPPSEDVRSPETYAGYARTENFASPERMARDSRKTCSLPAKLALNQWGFGGSWNAGAESGTLESAPGKIMFRFHSRDLHMVLGPAMNGKPVRFKVTLNGDDDHGSDSLADGTGEIRQPRMYQLIRQKRSIQDVTFEIEVLDPGVEAFSFTLG
jgi:thiol-disulfide isomerase/thioredoxin